MKVYNPGLGDAQTDQIVSSVMEIARAIWPEGTAEFQTWVNQQLANYGISWAKYQAQQASAALSNYTPLLWLGGGVLLYLALRK